MNRGKLVSEKQIADIIQRVFASYFGEIDLDTISRNVLDKKFNLINYNIEDLITRTRQREFDIESTNILFDVGDHAYQYLDLCMTIIMIHKTNKTLNYEIDINIPKSFFKNILSNKEACIDPSIKYIASDITKIPNMYISLKNVEEVSTSRRIKCLNLRFDGDDIYSKGYSVKKIFVSSNSSEFKNIQIGTDYREISYLINEIKINKGMNIGENIFVKDDGRLVRSDVVKFIKQVGNEEMNDLLENSKTNPSTLYLTTKEKDTSNRILELYINIKSNDTTISLSESFSQSSIYSVNWGDGLEDKRITHLFRTAGNYIIKIFDRIDDLSISSNKPIELTNISIPSGMLSPLEWNEMIIKYPFGGIENSTIKHTMSSVPEKLFINADRIIKISGLFNSKNLTSYSAGTFVGLNNLVVFDAKETFKYVTSSLPDKIFEDLYNVREAKSMFKDSNLPSIKPIVLEYMESLEDVTSMFENSKISNIDKDIFKYHNIKIADNLFKDTVSLNNKNITEFISTFLNKKYNLRSIKSMFDSTGVIINFNDDIIESINNCVNLMDLSSSFKSTNATNNTSSEFTIKNLTNLKSIANMFDSTSTFSIKSALLKSCSNLDETEIDVTNCLFGVTKSSESIVSDDDLFIETRYEGESGLFMK